MRGERTFRLADRIWVRIPAAVSRISPFMGTALADGDYLRRWPAAGVLAPVAAAVVGLFVGLTHPREVYSYSIAAMAVLAAVAGLGAALGFWSWLGFVAGDLATRPDLPFQNWVIHIGLPLLISYLVLGLLLVVMPSVASGFRWLAARRLEGRPRLALMAGHLTQLAVQAALAFSWAQAAAFLLRPVWTFGGGAPTHEGIAPLQFQSWLLALVTAGAVAVRFELTFLSGVTGDGSPPATSRRRPLPTWASVPAKAALFTLLLAGLFSSKGEATLFAAVLVGVLLLQAVVVPRLRGWNSIIRRIPLIVRALIVALVGYILASVIVVAALARGDSSFRSILLTLLLSLAVAAFLLPGPPAESREPSE